MPEHEYSIGRRLYAKADLRQDWEDELEAVSPEYWELFVDLLLVAAASAVADNFQEDQSLRGLYEFFLLYMAIVNGWLLYTHHYTSRFHEASLAHTLVLFFYMLGMAVAIVNASYETAAAFSMGIIIQRTAWLVMLVPVASQIPRAKDFVFALGLITIMSLLPHLVVVCQPDWVVLGWTAAAVIDMLTEVMLTLSLPGNKLVPVNIEHTKDRLGVLVLIMLGETVISSTITYREYARERGGAESAKYYSVLGLSFLLIFMFSLLFFNVQPHPKDHALRRSRFFGVCAWILNKWLGMSLLIIGVSVKLVVESVAENKPMSDFSNTLLTRAVGVSMVFLLLTRLAHFGGRVPAPSAPVPVKWLMRAWWILFAVVSIVPFFLPDLSQPIASLICISGLIFGFCVLESWFSHTLVDHLPGGNHSTEQQSLTEGQSSEHGYASF